MKITIRLLLLSTLILALFSCSKSGGSGGAPPKLDSLYSWRSIGGIAVTNGINDIWFTSQSKGYAAVSDGNLYQTQDSGKTWIIIPNTKVSSQSGMSNLFFTDAQYGFAQGAGGLQVTKDGGNTWTLQLFPTTKALNIFFSSRANGYYGDIDSGLYKTSDTGHTWTRTFRSTQTSIDYPVYFVNPARGFILTGDGTCAKTVDSSVSWQPVKTNIFTSNGTSPTFNTLQFIDTLIGYYASSMGVLKTTDGGQSWNSVFQGGTYINIIKFVSPTTGYFKTDYAIFKTTDGGQTWTNSLKLVNGDVIIGMFFLDSTTGWVCTGKGYIYRIDHQ